MTVLTGWRFVERLEGEVGIGRGFVPLLGSGISVPSGIPTAERFANYFLHCLQEALSKNLGNSPDLFPHNGEWPDFSVVKRKAKNGTRAVYAEVLPLINRAKDVPEDQESLDVFGVLEEGPGSLEKWRMGLECLARLFNPGNMLGHRDERIIDSFFTHLTSGREPNLGHKMLAHLADALRIQTILTTNFDSLAEEAFAELKMPLTVFDVHRRAGLPDAALVLDKRAIVKLHGGRFGLRADKTLDVGPGDDQTAAFQKYFQRTLGDSRAAKHLLVLGASCREERTMGFLRSVLKDLPTTQMYWVCYTGDDIEAVEEQFGEWKEQIHVAVHHDIGLLLLQLYQRLYHSLPSAGAEYPAFWRIPPDRYRPPESEPLDPHLEATFREGRSRILKKIGRTLGNPDLKRIVTIGGEKGVSSVCSAVCNGEISSREEKGQRQEEVFDGLSTKYHCIWLEIDDFISPGHVFMTLLTEAARKAGMAPPPPFYPEITPEKCKEHLCDYVTHSHHKFVVFLNGRDGPGYSAGWEPPDVHGIAEGHQPSSPWSTSQIAQFWLFLESLCSEGAENKENWLKDIVFVVMVRSAKPDERLLEAHPSVRLELRKIEGLPKGTEVGKRTRYRELEKTHNYIHLEECIGFSPRGIFDDVDKWLEQAEKRNERQASRQRRFVYAMTLFRHSRYPAALCSWALIKAAKRQLVVDANGNGQYDEDNDRERFREGMSWLETLVQSGAVRRQPGGFAWIHRDIRNDLRKRLENRHPELRGLRAECHQGIADWYMKLFRSSNDPLAALESLYHRLCCVEFADHSTTDDLCGDPEHIKETALIEAIVTLKLARERIVSCGYFTASSNVIRQVAQTASRLRLQRATEFYLMCNEVLRDFAREAADFQEAFYFNDKLDDGFKRPAPNTPATGAGLLLREDRDSLEAQYYKAVILTGLRSYDRAKDKFHDLFRCLGFPDITPGGCLWMDYDLTEMRKMARTWARLQKQDMHALKLAIRTARRYMFLEMLIAQAFQYQGGLDAAKTADEEHLYRRYSEGMYVFATEIMRYVDDYDFLQKENAYIRTLYGVLLATLGRYSEGHRRINEAVSYLAHSSKWTDAVTLAVADLRRAEIYILQAEAKSKQEKQTEQVGNAKQGDQEAQKAQAYLEDAHSCLLRARVCLNAGQRKDAWWWTWMYELEMRVCRCLVDASLPPCHKDRAMGQRGMSASSCQRSCEGKPYCIEVAMEASHWIVADPLRQARFTHLLHDLCEQLKQPGTKELEHSLDVLRKVREKRSADEYRRFPLAPQLDRYISLVDEMVAKHLALRNAENKKGLARIVVGLNCSGTPASSSRPN